MCKNCKASELGIARQAELTAALAEAQHININPNIHGFLARHAWKGCTPQYTDEQRAALDHYNTAVAAMKELHNDYIFDLGYQHAIEMQARRGGQHS